MTDSEMIADAIKRRNAEDAAFIATPSLWPSWPLLPMKRSTGTTGWPDTGLLVFLEGYSSTVFLTNLFDTKRRVGNLRKDFIDNEKVERKVYESVAAMLADGWMVD